MPELYGKIRLAFALPDLADGDPEDLAVGGTDENALRIEVVVVPDELDVRKGRHDRL